MKAKLVLITNDGEVGGGPGYIFNLASQVDPKEFSIYIISPAGWLQGKIKKSKIKAVWSEWPEGDQLVESPALLNQLLRDIKADKFPFAPIIVHAQSPKSAIVSAKAIRGLGIHFVYTEHLWTEDYRLSYLRQRYQLTALKSALKSASKVIAVSKAVAKFIQNHIVDEEKVEVIYPLIAEMKIKSAKNHQLQTGPIKREIKIGSVGSLNSTKNYLMLISAAEILNRTEPNFTLTIIGDGPERESIQTAIKASPIRNKIKLIFKVESEDLENYYKKWDVYVQPSISESFGLAVYQAQISGLAVVAFRVGGLAEIISNNQSGILVNQIGPDDLAKALEKLVSNHQLVSKMSKEATKIGSKKEFDPKRNFDRIVNIYRKLIS